MAKLYLCTINTGLITGEVIKIFARKSKYSHIAFSLNEELAPLYSFGRLQWFFPFPAGFVAYGIGTTLYSKCKKATLRLFEIEITSEQEQKIKNRLAPFLAAPRAYKYNYTNIITHIFKRPCHIKNQYVCTSFCAEILGDIIGLRQDPTLVSPQDFVELNYKIVYEGALNDYARAKGEKR